MRRATRVIISGAIVLLAGVVVSSPRPKRQIWACVLTGPAAPACDVLLGLIVPQESEADEVPDVAPPPPFTAADWHREPPPPPACPSVPPPLTGRELGVFRLHQLGCCAGAQATACEAAAADLEAVAPDQARRYRARACALGFDGSCEEREERGERYSLAANARVVLGEAEEQ